MAGRQIYNPDGFKNIEVDGKIVGYEFQFKAQYYRGFTLSILRDIKIVMDGEDVAREDILFCTNGEEFTLEECRTVIDPNFRWEFGEYATIKVMKEGGLAAGEHHLEANQVIAPSYMPFVYNVPCNVDFTI